MRIFSFLFVLVPTFFLVSGCYYDSAQVIYPSTPGGCDTTNVTYNATIAPIMSTFCNGCHSQQAPSGNVTTSSYTGLAAIASSKLYGTVAHLSGYNMMPKDGSTLPTCELAAMKRWINIGEPNN